MSEFSEKNIQKSTECEENNNVDIMTSICREICMLTS